MIPNNEIQAALISYLLSKTDITSELGDADDIREDQWQGRLFGYPNIRVRLIGNSPFNDDCGSRFTASIMVFTEDTSSKRCDRLSGIINGKFHSKAFRSNDIAFLCRTTSLTPAIRQDVRVWRSEVMIAGVAAQ
jgi:hypothetical protein